MWQFRAGSDQHGNQPMKLLEHVQKHVATTNSALPAIAHNTPLIQHIIATNQSLPEIAPTSMYEYVYGSNGTFVRAKRQGLTAIAPVSYYKAKGLRVLSASVQMTYPAVPLLLVEQMLEASRIACDADNKPVEIVFHLYFENGNWQLAIPDQEQTATSCKPLDNSANSTYSKAIIEIHSHHGMRAYFSDTDNRDETGFRIYGVMGEIFSNPQIRMRVGIYGHFYETAATGILELPAQLTDCLVEDW
ncbi:MAG: Mov34/MPN/PAD-1 family protein [Pseudanabaena sp. Salubria-1]|jgi:PRTRC genetic system protein A|nr:Mov34/MPN/PAD-1 family protein [Pseudanabaena sp. Salubria-1]